MDNEWINGLEVSQGGIWADFGSVIIVKNGWWNGRNGR